MDYIPSKDEIKKLLPLQYVCARLGIHFDGGNAICPFHEDVDPSFYLWEGNDGEMLWWCQPCGVGGDVFSLLQRFYGCTFPEAIKYALGMLAEIPPDYAPIVQTPRSKPVDMTDWNQHVLDAQARAADEAHSGYMATRVGYVGISEPGIAAAWDKWIRDNWRWGVEEQGSILMPHYAEDGTLVGCKVRSPSGDKRSLPGSVYSGQLYGTWRGKQFREVMITEGETDCVFASCQRAREKLPLDVLSLSSGAGYEIMDEWVAYLKSYETVYLAFDPDRAGISATWRWVAALGTQCRICYLPLGQDLREASPVIRNLIRSAGKPLDPPDGIVASVSRHGYFRPGKDLEEVRITNWWLDPVARLVGDDDSAGYEVVIHSARESIHAAVRLKDLSSAREAVKWCGRYGLVYADSDVYLKRIVKELEWRGSVVPDVYQTDQVGLHEPPDEYEFVGPTAVFPNGYVGKLPWRYVQSGKTADVGKTVLLPTTGVFHWNWLTDFLALSESAVTHPMIAWGVAAARRLEFEQFPLLFIGGSSGVGKSTLALMLLRLLGSEIEVDLGSVTPFILMRTLAASTTVPVFIDEWTRMSRKDSRESFQGAIPTLYTGGVGERGQADLTSMKYKLTSPVVVAGEDTFMLDREIQRTVTVAPSLATQDHEALQRITGKPIERFGQVLYTWLTSKPDLPEVTVSSQDRVLHNVRALQTGWQTLRALLHDAGRFEEVPDIPELPDLSGLNRMSDDENENVYEQAVLLGASMSDHDRHPLIWRDEDGRGTWVRFQALVNVIQRNIDLQLPGSSRAMKRYFEERYGKLELGAAVTPPGSYRPLRAWLIPGYELPESDDARGNYMPT